MDEASNDGTPSLPTVVLAKQAAAVVTGLPRRMLPFPSILLPRASGQRTGGPAVVHVALP
jgi:hypothetical protein